MLKLFGILISLFCISASADIYQWTDSKGQIQFGESIPKDVQNIKNIRKLDDRNLKPIIHMDRPQHVYYPYANSQRTESYQASIWPACEQQKRRAVQLEKLHEKKLSEDINAWLWQNCRQYSNELRTIEQQMM